MLRPRITPCLLIQNGGLVKTVQFGNPRYIGDPINAVRIFNEKEVDELIVLDIDATRKGREPEYDRIQHLASECRMPLAYGGGVKTAEQVKRIIGLGVEKVLLGSAVVENPGLIREASQLVGNQSVVAVVDVRRSKSGPKLQVFTHNGSRYTGQCAIELAQEAEAQGAGELIVNSIDQDGVMQGYDFEMAAQIRTAIRIPMTCLGGAGSLQHIARLIRELGVVGASAGSLFVFKGALRAVLINYPDGPTKDTLVLEALNQYYRKATAAGLSA